MVDVSLMLAQAPSQSLEISYILEGRRVVGSSFRLFATQAQTTRLVEHQWKIGASALESVLDPEHVSVIAVLRNPFTSLAHRLSPSSNP